MEEMKNRLGELRKEKELTINQMAERMGVQPITIERWEEGIKLPQLQKLAALSDMYGSSISYALGLTDIKRSNENQEVAPRLQEIRESYRMARHELAKELGVSSINSVYNWETGKAQMKLDVAIKTAKFFDVSLDYLLGLTHYKRWEIMSIQEELDGLMDGVEFPVFVTINQLKYEEVRDSDPKAFTEGAKEIYYDPMIYSYRWAIYNSIEGVLTFSGGAGQYYHEVFQLEKIELKGLVLYTPSRY